MTDQLHQQLADALRSIPMADTITVMQFKQWKEALAAYDAAKKEPAKRVKLPNELCGRGTWDDGWNSCLDDVRKTLKAQGIEAEQ